MSIKNLVNSIVHDRRQQLICHILITSLLTVLVNYHAETNTTHVETIQEVLYSSVH